MRVCMCLVGVVVALDQNEVLAVAGDEDESLLQGTHRDLNKPLTIKQDHGDLTEADLNALNEDGNKEKRELARAHYGAAKIAGNWSDDIAQQCTAEQMTEAKGDFSKSTCWYQADVFSCEHLDHIQARCCPYCIDPVDTSDVQIVHRRRTKIDWDATNARIAKGIADAEADAVRRRRTDQLECADSRGLQWCKKNEKYCKSDSWTRDNGCRKTCGTCGVEGTTTTTTCVELVSVGLCEPCLNALQCQSGNCCPNMFRCISDTILTCPGEHGQELAKSTCGLRDCENWPGCGEQKKFDDENGPFEDGAFCDVGVVSDGKQVIDPKTMCCETCGLDAEDAEEPEEPEDDPRDDSRDVPESVVTEKQLRKIARKAAQKKAKKKAKRSAVKKVSKACKQVLGTDGVWHKDPEKACTKACEKTCNTAIEACKKANKFKPDACTLAAGRWPVAPGLPERSQAMMDYWKISRVARKF